MGERSSEGIPFRDEDLKVSKLSKSGNIYEMPKKPGKIIKELELVATVEEEKGARMTRETWFARKDKFKAFADKYGWKIPAAEGVIGKNKDGEEAAFLVMDQIQGQDLRQIEKLPPESVIKLDKLLTSIAQHHYDAYISGSDQWNDFEISQIVYGHKYSETNDEFYIVDLDPIFEKIEDREHLLLNTLILARAIWAGEKKFDKASLYEARAKVSEIVESVRHQAESGRSAEYLSEIDLIIYGS